MRCNKHEESMLPVQLKTMLEHTAHSCLQLLPS